MKLKPTLVAVSLAFFAVSSFAQSHGCVGLALSSQQNQSGAYADTFSATAIIDVDLSVLFNPGSVNRFSGDHTVEVRFFTPSGSLYQSIAIPVTSDKAKNGSVRKIAGYPNAIPVKLLRETTVKGAKNLAADVRLPVAGTVIMSNSLYGRWTAEAYVDDEPLKCSVPASFTITP